MNEAGGPTTTTANTNGQSLREDQTWVHPHEGFPALLFLHLLHVLTEQR